jgi:hypothetical protein
MDLTTDEIERLRQLSNIGKPVKTKFKGRDGIGEPFLLGHIDDVVSTFLDNENRYEVQRIRCTPDQQQQHGEYLYRFGYYTARRDGRLCLGGQYSPIMTEDELHSLLGQLSQRHWF